MVMAKFILEILGLKETRACRRYQTKVMKSFVNSWAVISNSKAWELDTSYLIWVLSNPHIWNVNVLVIHK